MSEKFSDMFEQSMQLSQTMHQVDEHEMEMRKIYNKYERPAYMYKERIDKYTRLMNMLDKDSNELEHEIWWALQGARSEMLDIYDEQVQIANNLKKALRLGIMVVK